MTTTYDDVKFEYDLLTGLEDLQHHNSSTYEARLYMNYYNVSNLSIYTGVEGFKEAMASFWEGIKNFFKKILDFFRGDKKDSDSEENKDTKEMSLKDKTEALQDLADKPVEELKTALEQPVAVAAKKGYMSKIKSLVGSFKGKNIKEQIVNGKYVVTEEKKKWFGRAKVSEEKEMTLALAPVFKELNDICDEITKATGIAISQSDGSVNQQELNNAVTDPDTFQALAKIAAKYIGVLETKIIPSFGQLGYAKKAQESIDASVKVYKDLADNPSTEEREKATALQKIAEIQKDITMLEASQYKRALAIKGLFNSVVSVSVATQASFLPLTEQDIINFVKAEDKQGENVYLVKLTNAKVGPHVKAELVKFKTVVKGQMAAAKQIEKQNPRSKVQITERAKKIEEVWTVNYSPENNPVYNKIAYEMLNPVMKTVKDLQPIDKPSKP